MGTRILNIEGAITLNDGTTSCFLLHGEGDEYPGYTQWGATTSRLGQTVDVLDALRDGIARAGIEVGRPYPTPDPVQPLSDLTEALSTLPAGDLGCVSDELTEAREALAKAARILRVTPEGC